jgi:predicted DCC family thiol-disulfide oxidoreductase YuxK
MSSSWTGGQYSLFRVVLGAYLALHFAQLLPWGAELFSNEGVFEAAASPLIAAFPNVLGIFDAPGFVSLLLALGLVASVALATGIRDRAAAMVILYLLACLLGRNPLISNPSLPFVGWLLLAHAFIPGAPYGSWQARGRINPGGSWQMPKSIHNAAWIVLALAYSYSGWHKLSSPSWVDGSAFRLVLENPLAHPTALREWILALPEEALVLATWAALATELLFAPLALVRHLRPVIWGAMLAMHLGLIVLVDFADLSFGMVLIHLFTFDPAWFKPPVRQHRTVLLYDGECGLCHGFVRFLLAEDTDGHLFAFEPLQTEYGNKVPGKVILQPHGGQRLEGADAVLVVLSDLGGWWRVTSLMGRCCPRRVRDLAYAGVARVRRRLAPAPKGLCPMLPPELQARFMPLERTDTGKPGPRASSLTGE